MGTLHPLSARSQAPSIGPAWPGLCRAPQPTGCTPGPRILRGRKTAAGNLKILLLGGTGAGSPPGPQPRPPASPASSARMPPGVCAAPAQRPEHPGLLRPLSGSCCPGSRGSHCQQVTALRGAGAAGQRGAVNGGAGSLSRLGQAPGRLRREGGCPSTIQSPRHVLLCTRPMDSSLSPPLSPPLENPNALGSSKHLASADSRASPPRKSHLRHGPARSLDTPGAGGETEASPRPGGHSQGLWTPEASSLSTRPRTGPPRDTPLTGGGGAAEASERLLRTLSSLLSSFHSPKG